MSSNSLDWQLVQVEPYHPLRIKHSMLILGLIVLMFVGDAANAILLKTGSPFWRVSILVRTFALVYFVYLLARIPQGWSLLRLVAVLFAIFFIGAFFSSATNYHYDWFENINIATKMVFFFICWQTFRLYFKTSNERAWLFRIFEYLILLQALSIIIGYIFDIDLFYSYGSFKRFGYKGFIPARNELSGFLLISFFYFARKVVIFGKGVIPLFLVFISALLTGAKVALSFPLILILLMGYWSITRRKKKSFLYVLILLVIFLVLAIWQREYIFELITPTLTYFQQQLAYGHNPNILSLFFSGRDLLVIKLLDSFRSNLNLMGILFGGHELSILSSETDLVDVFLFIGLIGTIIFYTFYIKTLLYCERRKNFIHFTFVLTWLVVSTLAGHLVFSAINGSYLAILLLAFSWQENANRGTNTQTSKMPKVATPPSHQTST